MIYKSLYVCAYRSQRILVILDDEDNDLEIFYSLENGQLDLRALELSNATTSGLLRAPNDEEIGDKISGQSVVVMQPTVLFRVWDTTGICPSVSIELGYVVFIVMGLSWLSTLGEVRLP